MTSSTEQIIVKNRNSWWRRRSALERGLGVMSVCMLLICIGLIIGIEVFATRTRTCDRTLNELSSSKSKTEKGLKIIGRDVICMTPKCIHTASIMLDKMDLKVDPCENFYQFSCGGFHKNTIIPDDKAGVDTFSILDEELQKHLRTSLGEKINDNDTRTFKLTKTLYQNCINKSSIEQRGLEPMYNVLEKFGGWPLLHDNWNENNFEWKDFIYKTKTTGYSVDYFLTFNIEVDSKNSSKYIISLDQPYLTLPREYLLRGLENKIVNAYFDLMVDVAVVLGGSKYRVTKELLESLDFEMELAKIVLPNDKRRNASELYNPMTIAELSKLHPSVAWLEYMNKMMEPFVELDSNEIVNIRDRKYIMELEKLLRVTPKRVQANYALGRVVYDSIGYLNEDIKRKQLIYWTKLTGETEREPRWRECVSAISDGLALSVAAVYVKKYFKEEAKEDVFEMVTGIRKEFRKIIEKVDWMDEETRSAALEKIDAMSTFIAYPDELLDNDKLDKHYESLTIEPGKYFESALNITVFMTEYTLSQLRKSVNKSDWISYGGAADVNAYYSPSDNSMQLPAGVLHGQFYDKNRPQYLNYGSIGFIIGHEITHGFDDQGSQYDKKGNVVNWWREETRKKFLQKAECIVRQYENYTDSTARLKLSGVNTQSENIADNSGVKEAYYAYNDWERRNGKEPMLPGLDYTPRQMFWVSAANVWCSKQRLQAQKLDILTDQHSPGEFRVIGSMSNMPEFARDFNCPIGSKMNPVKKCAVW